MHVNDINNIVCTIKKTTVFQFTYTLLSQYEFLYSSLVKIYSHPPPPGVLGVHAVVCHGCGV